MRFGTMADWQEAVQASLIALIFALMVAKLASVLISFRGENLRVERAVPVRYDLLSDADGTKTWNVLESMTSSESENSDEEHVLEDIVGSNNEKVIAAVEARDLHGSEAGHEGKNDAYVGLHPLAEEVATKNSSLDVEAPGDLKLKALGEHIDGTGIETKKENVDRKTITAVETSGPLSDSDDWEGVESTELEETFSAAATFVSTQAVGPGLKVSNETQLLLYGLYKLATEGPCTTPQPSAYKMSARAKWNAWQKLGNSGQEEAMHRYIAVVSEISPSWCQGMDKTKKLAGDRVGGDASQHAGMGPVFSCLAMNEEGDEAEGTLETIHMCARDGDQAGLHQQIEIGTPIDLTDSDGRTALHWAADQGHLLAVELLLARGAQIHAKDLDGQTALHYATTCEQEEVAKYLVLKGAEASMKDNEGVSPLSSRPEHWFWMGGKT